VPPQHHRLNRHPDRRANRSRLPATILDWDWRVARRASANQAIHLPSNAVHISAITPKFPLQPAVRLRRELNRPPIATQLEAGSGLESVVLRPVQKERCLANAAAGGDGAAAAAAKERRGLPVRIRNPPRLVREATGTTRLVPKRTWQMTNPNRLANNEMMVARGTLTRINQLLKDVGEDGTAIRTGPRAGLRWIETKASSTKRTTTNRKR